MSIIIIDIPKSGCFSKKNKMDSNSNNDIWKPETNTGRYLKLLNLWESK